MKYNLESDTCIHYINDNLVEGTDTQNTTAIIIDLSNHFILISNLYTGFDLSIRECVSKILLENMILEYAENPDLEGGMFIENVQSTLLYDISNNPTVLKFNIDADLFIESFNVNYEFLDIIYAEIYGMLSSIYGMSPIIIPYTWIGKTKLGTNNTVAKLALYTHPDMIIIQ
jgi:hypothetical protein